MISHNPTASHGWLEPSIFAICPLARSVVSRTLATWWLGLSPALHPRISRHRFTAKLSRKANTTARLQAETLAHVVSSAEEPFSEGRSPTTTKTIRTASGLNADGTDKGRYTSTMPSNTEALRTKYEVLTSLWFFAQSRQPGREMLADFTAHLDEFSERTAERGQLRTPTKNPRRSLGTPAWTHCLKYEYQLRTEALRLCFEEGYSSQEALWAAYSDPQHRMKLWIQPLSVPNSNAYHQKMAALERKVAELERKATFLPTSTTCNQERRQRQEEQWETTRSPGRCSGTPPGFCCSVPVKEVQQQRLHQDPRLATQQTFLTPIASVPKRPEQLYTLSSLHSCRPAKL